MTLLLVSSVATAVAVDAYSCSVAFGIGGGGSGGAVCVVCGVFRARGCLACARVVFVCV